MRSFCLAILLLMGVPCPARATLFVVHANHPVAFGLFGYNGVYRPALRSTHRTIAAAMDAAVTPGDTVYVYPAGPYDENILASQWRANDVVLTGIRANPVVAGQVIPMVGRATIQPTSLIYLAFYMELPGGGPSARTGCRMEYLRLKGAFPTPAIGIRVNGTQDFTLGHCWVEGNLSSAIVQGAGASKPDLRTLNFTVDACSLGIAPSAPTALWPVMIAPGLGSGGAAIWGGDNVRLTNCTIDLRNVRLSRGNLGSVLFAATLHSRISNNIIRTAVPAAPGFYCGIGVLSQGITPAITDSLEIADNTIEVTPVGDPGAKIVALTMGMSLGSPGSICDGVHVFHNTFHMPFDRAGTYFGVKVEADYSAPDINDDNAFSDRIVIERNVVENGTVGIGLHENARNSQVVYNQVTFGDTTAVSHGLVLEDARFCEVANNRVRGFQRGISLEPSNSDNPPGPGWHNLGNRIHHNTFEACGRALNVVQYEPPPAAQWDADDTLSVAQDSLGVWEGNITAGCSAFALFQSFDGSAPSTYAEAVRAMTFTFRTAAWWNAHHPHGLTAADPAPSPLWPTLLDPFPNPFRARASVAFAMPRPGPLELDIYSCRGERVRDLHHGVLPAGTYQVDWDGTDMRGRRVASGVYYVRLQGVGAPVTRRLILAK